MNEGAMLLHLYDRGKAPKLIQDLKIKAIKNHK